MADTDFLFSQAVPDDHPRLQRLFEQAKRDFWDEATVIDWSRDFQIPARHRRPLARILSIIYYGERAALEVSAQLLTLVKDEQAKFVLAAQVLEEAKHVSVFRRVLTKLDEIHPVERWSRILLSDLVRVRHPVAKLIGMQLIVENVANHLFRHIGDAVDDPLLKEVLAYVERDEKKHTGLAAIYLPTVLPKLSSLDLQILKARQAFWCFALSRTIYNHRYDAEELGIEIYEAMVKGLESQERLVEAMGTRRGVWKNELLEKSVLRLWKRDAERRRASREARRPTNGRGGGDAVRGAPELVR